jgi:hypothetical protein
MVFAAGGASPDMVAARQVRPWRICIAPIRWWGIA